VNDPSVITTMVGLWVDPVSTGVKKTPEHRFAEWVRVETGLLTHQFLGRNPSHALCFNQ